MKELFRNISSIFLALMVLLSTVSWTVDKHLCMGRVMDVSFFTLADDCCMEQAMAAMGTDAIENHCCDDESFTLEGQDNLKLSNPDLDIEQQWFLVALVHSYLALFTPVEELPVPHEKYPPPIMVRDIHILDQVFLI
ncbi:HYC_CC_PP family protein [Flagellimonas sp. 2504JD4-2]